MSARRPRPPGRPRLYFSFRSPYSWLTVRRLRSAVPGCFDEIDWIPFWDPDPITQRGLQARGAEFHYVQMSRAKHFYLLTDTKRLAAREGLAMAWPIDVAPWWELPHLGWLVARRHGRAEQYYDAVTAARWGEGLDICTPEVLGPVAERAGLPVDEVLGAPDDPALRAESVECLVSAYQDDIFGIPYLRLGRGRFWGYDRLDAFLEQWAGTRAPAPAPAPAPGDRLLPAGAAGYDGDTGGGCG